MSTPPRLVFLSKDVRSTQKMSVTALMNRFCEHGYDVTLISETGCDIKFDFKYDYRLKRLAFNMGVKGCATRAELLAHFLSGMPASVFILTDFDREVFQEYAAVIKAACGGHKTIFLPHLFVASMLDRRPAMLEPLLELTGHADAVVSNTAYAHVSQNARLGGKSVRLPYFYPYGEGEYGAAAPGGKSVLLFGGSEETIARAMEELAAFVKSDPEITLKIAAGRKYRGTAGIYMECVLALGLEDRVVCDESDRYDELMQDCAFAVVTSKFVYPCDAYVQLTARRLPVLFASSYCESAFLSADLARGGMLAEKCAELMGSPAQKAYHADLTGEASERTFALWEALVADVAAGKTPRGAPLAEGDSEEAFLAHFDEMLTRERPEPVKSPFSLKKSLRRLKSSIRGSRLVRGLRDLIKRNLYYKERFRVQHYVHMIMSPEQIRKSQLLALKMFIEFERICKKYNLRYYVAAGSLLGAVRSGNMIPWDDDIDVTMPRPDYDKFLQVAPGELPEDMVLPQSTYPYNFHRILIRGTNITRYLQHKGPHGVFLDVLPLDGAAPTEKQKEKHWRRSERLYRLMRECNWPQPLFTLHWKRIILWTTRLVIKCFAPRKLLYWLWKRNAAKYDCESAAEWVCLPGLYGYEKECFPKEYWGEPAWLPFEGRKIPVMHEWEAYLLAHYRDYSMPPPALFRRTHTLFSIDFGKYETMTVEKIEREVEEYGRSAR